MKEKIGFLVYVWFLLCGFSVGRFVVEKNCLKVTSPNSLKNVYECAFGDFGVPQYGGALFGTVFYPKDNQRACKSFRDFDISFKSNPGGLPTFLLVDRGDCYFKLKAWNAQNGGAAAILFADDITEPLITFDTPEELPDYLPNITIPSALISKSLGDSIKKALSDWEMVNINLDWTEALPHPDERVKYEFWTNSNDECGPNCDSQIDFVKNFKGAAQVLERKGYTQFTPHYITWYCPEAFVLSKRCRAECINHGRYCAPDPEQDFSKGYDGRDVVVQNLRQACFYKVANESGRPWLWWDYVTDFAIRCPMKEKKYNAECSNQVIESLGVDLKKIEKCIGDPTADEENAVLKAEQDLQIGKGTRGDVTILPTLIINNRQYRGKLAKGAVLKAVCAGFQGTTKPAVCLTEAPYRNHTRIAGEEGEHFTDFVPEESAVRDDEIKVDKESIDMLSALVISEIPRVSEVEPQVVVPSQGYGRHPQGIRRLGINTPSSYLFMENIFGDGGLWKEFKLGLSFSIGDSKQG